MQPLFFALCATVPNLCHDILNTFNSLHVMGKIISNTLRTAELEPLSWFSVQSLSRRMVANNRARIYGTLWILPGECKAQDVFNMEGLYLWFMHLLFDVYYHKDSTMPKLQFSYASEKHVFGYPAPEVSYKIGKDECITADPF
jgi:hypothetical protein